MQIGSCFGFAVLCSLALCIKAAARIPLDMAPDCVDDMYDGCSKDALKKFVLSDWLPAELNNSAEFRKAWRQSQLSACPKLIPGGLKEHTDALQTIAMDDEGMFRQTLNNAVYAYGTNASTYEDSFYFKSLHFLLMDSIQRLNPGLTVCKTVYALSDLKFNAQQGSTVRLGRFFIGYSSLEILKEDKDLDDEDILKITSCFYADLGDNICNEEQITLLSPTETFTVDDVRDVNDQDVSYHLITLKHLKLKSMHNCYIFSRSADFSSHWLFLALLTPYFIIIS